MTRVFDRHDLLLIAAGTAAFLAAAKLDRKRRDAARQGQGRPHRVVVLGAGFGGLSAAQSLCTAQAIDLTVIDAQNHHLFQPLLYQVATAALPPADIAAPIRDIIPASPNTRVMMGAVTGIDVAAQTVSCAGERVPYDELIVATGSEPSYFGNDDWSHHAPGLKTLHDALDLRGRILLAFEKACVAQDAAEQARLLTFVLIGAGPTGVEMAGSIAQLSREMLALDHELSRTEPTIILVEAGKRVLAEFPDDLGRYAAASLEALGVTIRTGAKVTAIEQGTVHLEDDHIEAATIIWTAGTAATPVAEWLGIKPEKGGRVAVDANLRVPGHPAVHVIGDAALAYDRSGRPLPGLAPVAKQQGDYVARAIRARLAGRPLGRRFTYRDYGTLATIGRAKAVAAFGPVHLTGLVAWAVWAMAHIFFLIGFRNRLMVSAQWALAYATDRRPGRLIAWSAIEVESAAGPSPAVTAKPLNLPQTS